MMEPWLQMLVAYGVGTLAGIWLFRRAVLEHTIVQTIDDLVRNDYARSYTNEEGEVELYKWYELDDVIEELARQKEIDDSIREAVEIQERMWEDEEEDDTP